jgi:hypothetical protein
VTSAATTAPAPTSSRLRWWREALYIVAFYFVYSVVRNLQGSDAARARAHALQIVRAEKMLGIYHELRIQHLFGLRPGADFVHLHWRTFVQFWNVYYGSAHFVVSIVALVWLFRTDKGRYPLWRNTLAFTTALALIGFAAYPLMPPRLLSDHGFVDTLKQVGGLWSFDSGAMQKVSNQYAAMPSLHCAWSLWVACVFWPAVRSPWGKAVVIAYPLMTVFAIVVTANHYLLDAVGGAAVFGVAYLMARAFTLRMDARANVRAGAL